MGTNGETIDSVSLVKSWTDKTSICKKTTTIRGDKAEAIHKAIKPSRRVQFFKLNPTEPRYHLTFFAGDKPVASFTLVTDAVYMDGIWHPSENKKLTGQLNRSLRSVELKCQEVTDNASDILQALFA